MIVCVWKQTTKKLRTGRIAQYSHCLFWHKKIVKSDVFTPTFQPAIPTSTHISDDVVGQEFGKSLVECMINLVATAESYPWSNTMLFSYLKFKSHFYDSFACSRENGTFTINTGIYIYGLCNFGYPNGTLSQEHTSLSGSISHSNIINTSCPAVRT